MFRASSTLPVLTELSINVAKQAFYTTAASNSLFNESSAKKKTTFTQITKFFRLNSEVTPTAALASPAASIQQVPVQTRRI